MSSSGDLRSPLSDEALEELSDAFAQREFERAAELVDRGLETEPDHPILLHLKAMLLIEQGQFDQFRAVIDQAIAGQPSNSGALVTKANGLIHLGELEEAHAVATTAVEVDVKASDAWDVLALTCLHLGRKDDALNAAEKAVGLSQDVSPLFTLAEAELHMNEVERSLATAEKILAGDPRSFRALKVKMTSLARLDRTDEALAVSERAHEISPEHQDPVRVMASALFLQERYSESEAAFEKWTELNSDEGNAWTGLALSRRFQGKDEEALAAFRRAVDLAPDDGLTRQWLAAALIEVGDHKEALSILVERTGEDPRDEEAWLGRCVAERELGFELDAIQSAREALSLADFGQAPGWLELARSYSSAGRHAQARHSFEMAKELDRDSFDASLGVAVESILCHDEARALGELAEIDERLGSNALVEYNRGVALYRLGREGSARDAWRRASDLDPELGAAHVLTAGHGSGAPLGGWTDYWFGDGASSRRKIGGAGLVILLIAALAIPFIEPNAIPGIATGRLNLETFVPAIVVALLLTLPAIRALAVGNVSVDVMPIGAPHQSPAIDAERILPVFAREELDVMQLTRRY